MGPIPALPLHVHKISARSPEGTGTIGGGGEGGDSQQRKKRSGWQGIGLTTSGDEAYGNGKNAWKH